MILVGTPSGEDIKARTVICREGLQTPVKSGGFLSANMIGTYVDRNQNFIVDAAIENDTSHVMFIDSDMIFPVDVVTKLLERKKDIVGCVYRARGEPHYLAAMHLNGEMVNGSEIGIGEMKHIPSGMMLVKTKVFREMGYPWFFNTYGNCSADFVGNDINFCYKARENGFKVYADFYLSRSVSHYGEVPLKWQM